MARVINVFENFCSFFLGVFLEGQTILVCFFISEISSKKNKKVLRHGFFRLKKLVFAEKFKTGKQLELLWAITRTPSTSFSPRNQPLNFFLGNTNFFRRKNPCRKSFA
jgi:hypothetical protein